jgi:hypothetical protein
MKLMESFDLLHMLVAAYSLMSFNKKYGDQSFFNVGALFILQK